MKRLQWAFLLILGLGLFAACTTPPITVSLADVSFDLAAVNTLGVVVFPRQPVEVESPPPATQVASVTVQGFAKLDQPATVEFKVFAADVDPGALGCTLEPFTNNFYLCWEDTAGIEQVGSIDFNNTAGPVPFRLAGGTLARGINKNSLYLGLGIGREGTLPNTLTLYDMTATLRLSLGR